ncbi:hypothetical protein LCGC14_2293560 [marine sediment metagenome]|uniref:RNA ligase domain-containing protein n=1 Tax=marine sediment metagenome TaxID=412755 RepID=A0A0F9CR04_9ZZZZ
MRQLASIQKIIDIQPIKNYDRIEVATVLGWKVIVGKDDFKIGDLCVYIEADSILPQVPEFEFLRKRCWSPKWNGFRIRNMKLGGIYSQGIVFSMSILSDEIMKNLRKKRNVKEDVEVTEELGIIKYDPPEIAEVNIKKQIANKPWIIRKFLRVKFIRNYFYPESIKYHFPDFLRKTDETRVQILPHILEQYKGLKCYITEKLDGTSVTFALKDEKFYVCSRNRWLKKANKKRNKYWRIAKEYHIEEILKSVGKDIAIQGEIIGPGIQGNKYQLDEPRFFMFNVFNIVSQKYYNFKDLIDFSYEYILPVIPLLDDNYNLPNNVDQILEDSKGTSLMCPKIPREGIVIRYLFDLQINTKGMPLNFFSFKAINPDFDLKYGEEEEEYDDQS